MMIVGYIRSSQGLVSSCKVQKHLIELYCQSHQLQCQKYFCDLKSCTRNSLNVNDMRAIGFSEAYRQEKSFPQWDEMLKEIYFGRISTILVDFKSRLFTNRKQWEYFYSLCEQKRVEIIEVSKNLEPISQKATAAAIYHFTDRSQNRPVVFEKEIDKLYQFASHGQWEVRGTFIDFSLRKSEHKEFERFKLSCDDYSALILKDFYHIDDKMGVFLRDASELEKHGITLLSIQNGRFKIVKNPSYLQERLQIAIYDAWHPSKELIDLNIEILKTFVALKTNWIIKAIYCEDKKLQRDHDQMKLEALIRNRTQYDLIMVDSFTLIHHRTSMFFKKRKELALPIYSMKEGGLGYERI